MSDVALQTKGAGVVPRLATAVRQLIGAVAEGVAAARRYERLSTMRDPDLARLGITRDDLPWYALCGTRRPC
jgi:uncharacterized protein YjiS (DUF1127 family)